MRSETISSLITIDTIKNWSVGDVITIKAGTGTGKSYFIKNKLYAFAKANNKKILMLIHRTNCVNQFETEIKKDKKTDVIHIKTYQSLESLKNKHNKEVDFSDYEYIVCDEFHYFLGDANYNKTTDISLNTILEQTFVTKIFMSATGDYMKGYINTVKEIETIDYELPINFNFIEDLTFFNKDESVEKFIEDAIEKGYKCIFFMQSAERAYELSLKYKDHCLFNCSKSNEKHYKYVDAAKITKMLAEEKFEEQILITTTCLDAGVNINDDDVTHIICDVKDVGSLIQCIGRKRLKNDSEKIRLFIKTISNRQLGGMKSQLKMKVVMADYLRKHTVKEFIEKYPRENDYSYIVYDAAVTEENKCTKKVNELMYYKSTLDIYDIDKMLAYKTYGYCKYLANKFGLSGTNGYKIYEEKYISEDLETYLDNIVGKKLFKYDQIELIKKINVNVNGRLQKSYKKLNDGLKMIDLHYVIESKREQINSTRCTYWIAGKTTFTPL